MNDYFIGHIRTFTPIIVGGFISWLATLGIDIDPSTQVGLIVVLTGVIQSVYYAIVRALAAKWAIFGSLLIVNKAPAYEPEVT